jgi:hypothetical protein
MAPAATLAAMLMVAWFGMWGRLSSPPLPTETGQESFWPVIEGVSAALFPTVEIGFTVSPDRLFDLGDLQAALAGEWPCEEPAAFANLDCDDNTFALLLGGP